MVMRSRDDDLSARALKILLCIVSRSTPIVRHVYQHVSAVVSLRLRAVRPEGRRHDE
jgi:hypothetical protein